jgi:hypothetical protein
VAHRLTTVSAWHQGTSPAKVNESKMGCNNAAQGSSSRPQGLHGSGAQAAELSSLPKAADAAVATLPGAHTKRHHQASLGIVVQQARPAMSETADGIVASGSTAPPGRSYRPCHWAPAVAQTALCGTQWVLLRVKAKSHETHEALNETCSSMCLR